MRLALALLLLAALAAAPSAQEAPAPPPAGDLSPLGLTNVVAYAWADVAALVPPPDSGAVVEGAGRLLWRAPDAETERLDVWVRHGTVDAVTVTTTPAGVAELAASAERLAEALGEPADGDFYTAAQLRSLPGPRPYVDLAVRPERREYTLRKPLAPPPGGPPPGQ